MRVRCQSCKGEYERTQRDGARYFHACAPLANPAHQPDPAAPAFDPRETVERRNKRDENLVIDAASGKVRAISEGDGALDLG